MITILGLTFAWIGGFLLGIACGNKATQKEADKNGIIWLAGQTYSAARVDFRIITRIVDAEKEDK